MNWKAELISYKNENRILVHFEKKTELIERFKKLAGRKYIKTLQAWHLPDNPSYTQTLSIYRNF